MLLLCGPALYGAVILAGVAEPCGAWTAACWADWDSGPVWVYHKKDGSRTLGEVEYHRTGGHGGATLVFGDLTSKQVTPYRLPNGYAVVVLRDTKAAVLVRLYAEVDEDHAVGVCRMRFADGKVWLCRAERNTIPYAGDGLEHLQEIRNLPGLNLSGRTLTNKELRVLKELPHLQWLNLSCTNLGDQHLSYLEGLKELRHIRLVNTKITSKGYKQLAALLPEAKIEFRFPHE